MLLTREEMWFDFGGAKLDPVADRDAIAWAMNQFLYGEVTGITFALLRRFREFVWIAMGLACLALLTKGEKAAVPVP